MNALFIFLALVSVVVGFFEQDRIMIMLAVFPLFIDMLLLLGLGLMFYHYFLLSTPFYLLAFSKVFEVEYKLIKFFVLLLLLLSIVFNFPTLEFYLNPTHAQRFFYIMNLVKRNVRNNDTIFGEPVITNYISFVTRINITSNYLDSYIYRITFEGEEKLLKTLESEKPRIIIEMKNYYMKLPKVNNFILKNYFLLEEVKGFPEYLIYKSKI
jgi:hypothetical protein